MGDEWQNRESGLAAVAALLPPEITVDSAPSSFYYIAFFIFCTLSDFPADISPPRSQVVDCRAALTPRDQYHYIFTFTLI